MPKYSGWGIRDRPFSKSEYENSYLKKNNGKSYTKYLQSYAKFVTKQRKIKTKKVKKRRNNINNIFGFDFDVGFKL